MCPDHDSEPPNECLSEGMLRAAFRQPLASVDRLLDLPHGLEIGDFRVVRFLGQGGMGEVYQGLQISTGRTVAIKFLSPQARVRGGLRRFEREAALLGAIAHPGVAQVYQAGQVELPGQAVPWPFFAMEYVEGPHLDDYRDEHGATLPQLVELCAKLCDAVQHAHQRGVLHRDLKPANVLVVETEEGPLPKVLDFGVARLIQDGDDSSDQGYSTITVAGQLVGTPGYMSPEQLTEGSTALDTRSDVYSIGACAYRVLTGRTPHNLSGLSPYEAGQLVLRTEPQAPQALCPEIGRDLNDILLTALEKDPNRRYASASELGADLRRYLRGEPVLARPHTALYLLSKAIRRRPKVALGLALVSALVVGFGITSWVQARRYARLAARETEAQESLKVASDTLRLELSRSRLETGYQASRSGNRRAAEEVLWGEFLANPGDNEVRWALRDTYARHPIRQASAELGDSEVYALAALPGGERLLAATEYGTLRLFSLPGLVAQTLEAHGNRGLQRLVLSPSNESVVFSSGDRFVQILDARTCAVEHQLELQPDPAGPRNPAPVALWPGRPGVLIAGDEGRLHQMDCEAGQPIRTVYHADGLIVGLAVSADGNLAVIAESGGDVSVLRSRGQGFTLRNKIPGVGETPHMAIALDENILCCSTGEPWVLQYDLLTGALLVKGRSRNGSVRFVERHGEGFLVGGWYRLMAWEAGVDQYKTLILGPTAAIADLPQRGGFLTASMPVYLWDDQVLDPAASAVQLDGWGAFARGWSEGLVWVSDATGAVLALDDVHGGIRRSHVVAESRVRSLVLSPDGQRIYCAAEDGLLRVVDAVSGSELAEPLGTALTSQASLDLSSDGTRIAHGTASNRVGVRDATTLQLQWQSEALSGVFLSAVFFGAEGGVLCGTRGKASHVIQAGGTSAGSFEPAGKAWCAAWAETLGLAVSSTWDGVIYLWDPASGQAQRRLVGHRGVVWDLALHPINPRLLLSAGSDGTARIWDMVTGRSLMVLEVPGEVEVLSACFSADGERVFLGTETGAILLRDLRQADHALRGNLNGVLEGWRLRDGLGLDPDLTEGASRVLEGRDDPL